MPIEEPAPVPTGELEGQGANKNPFPPRRRKVRACPELAEGMGVRPASKAMLNLTATPISNQGQYQA